MKKYISLFKELNVLAHEVKDNFTIEAYDNLINKIEEISMKGNFDNIVVENLFNSLQYLKENKNIDTVDYICSSLNAIIINNDFYIRKNSLFDRIKDIYEELYRLYLNVKEFNENDSYYLELVRLNNMLHEEVNNGVYDSLVKDYPNIKEVLLEDFYLEKREYNYDGILLGEDDKNIKAFKNRLEEFSSYNLTCVDDEELSYYYDVMKPIIDNCRILFEEGNYEEKNGVIKFEVEYNGDKLYVYDRLNTLVFSRNGNLLDSNMFNPNNRDEFNNKYFIIQNEFFANYICLGLITGNIKNEVVNGMYSLVYSSSYNNYLDVKAFDYLDYSIKNNK